MGGAVGFCGVVKKLSTMLDGCRMQVVTGPMRSCDNYIQFQCIHIVAHYII